MNIEMDYMRERLEVVIGVYQNLADRNECEPVRPVLEHAQKLLDGGFTRDQFLELADEIAAVMPEWDRKAQNRRGEWEAGLEAIAFATAPRPPDPERWRAELHPAGREQFCPTCNRSTLHTPYSQRGPRSIGINLVHFFCRECWSDGGV